MEYTLAIIECIAEYPIWTISLLRHLGLFSYLALTQSRTAPGGPRDGLQLENSGMYPHQDRVAYNPVCRPCPVQIDKLLRRFIVRGTQQRFPRIPICIFIFWINRGCNIASRGRAKPIHVLIAHGLNMICGTGNVRVDWLRWVRCLITIRCIHSKVILLNWCCS